MFAHPERRVTHEPLKLTIVNSNYEFYTRVASENARALAFSVLGSVWILAGNKQAGVVGVLLWASILAVGALLLDTLQYVWLADVYRRLTRKAEKARVPSTWSILSATRNRKLGVCIYHLKLICLLGACVLLGIAFVRRMR